jgi:hypothetical protein
MQPHPLDDLRHLSEIGSTKGAKNVDCSLLGRLAQQLDAALQITT